MMSVLGRKVVSNAHPKDCIRLIHPRQDYSSSASATDIYLHYYIARTRD